MKSFRTEVSPQPTNLGLSLKSKFMLVGSCFSNNIGDKLINAQFRTIINPHGIVFSPLSIAQCLDDYLKEKKYNTSDLTPRRNEFVSLHHHGNFSSTHPKELVDKINVEIKKGSDFLKKTDVLILTLGTAWTYFYESTQRPVANCHQLPGKDFTKKLVDSSTIFQTLSGVFEKLVVANPRIRIILTVSPVRHWKDGVVENALSKSNLLIAINQLARKFSKVYYFPAYEIMMDDLRDYRFYNPDMLHPSPLAVDYIWQKFQETYFDITTRKKVEKIEKLMKIFDHRPQDIEAHQKKLEQTRKQIEEIVER